VLRALGIGTTSPTNGKIEISNSDNGYEGLRLEDSRATPSANKRTVDIRYTGANGRIASGTEMLYLNDSNASSTKPFIQVDGSSSTHFVLDSSGNVGIGTSSPVASVDIKAEAGAFNTTYNSFDGVNMFLRGAGTAGSGNYGSGIAWSVVAGSDEKMAAISSVQTGSDANQVGLAFFTHVSTTGGDPLVEAMRINSSGSVGIGTTSPDTIIHVMHSTSPTLTLERNSTSIADSNVIGRISMAHKDSNDAGVAVQIIGRAEGTAGAAGLAFNTGTPTSIAERVRIDSSGNVGIGTTTVDSLLHLQKSDVTAYSATATDGQVGIGPTIYLENPANSNATVGGQIVFGMRSTEAQARIGATGGASPALVFGTNDAEAMRIDSLGNLFVGKTSTGLTAGFEVQSTGQITASQSNAPSAKFNRITNDGEIIRLHKDGTTVGSISTLSGNISIGSGNAGLRFNPPFSELLPHNVTTNSGTDATVILGSGGVRFKDLYLSGGVYLGGTGSANHLDDYEEGLYTVAITCNTSGTITVNSSFDQATYTKVGRLVTVTGLLAISAISSPVGSFSLSLPFTAAALAERAVDSAGSVILDDTVSANCSDFIANIVEGTTSITIRLGDATDLQTDSAEQVKVGTNIIFSATYVAA
jgi:hypothetical protein